MSPARRDRPAGRERGSVAVEFTLLAPVFLVLLLLVVGLGRLTDAHGEVDAAAADAARAASLARTPASAADAARRAAADHLDAANLSCSAPRVDVDTASFTAGGYVRVRLACTVDLSQLTVSGLPGRATLTSTATAPVETFRGLP